MSYIDNNLLPDEKIIFRTRKHIIIFFWPAVWAILCVYAWHYMALNAFLVKFQLLPVFVVAVLWAAMLLNYTTSEFAVTTKRLMMREGFFYRHANEMRLSAISQVNVDQSLLGQLLNYGSLSINAFGAFDGFPLISRPFEFQKAVNEQLDKVVSR